MEEDVKTNDATLPILDIRSIVKVEDITSSIKQGLLDGKLDATKTGIVLKKMAKVSEELFKDEEVKDVITRDTQKYIENGKTGKVFGATLTYAAVYTDYDFEECGHPELTAWYNILAAAKERIKQIEEELKLLVDTKNSAITPNTGKLNFGIKATTKPIIIEQIPTIVMENSGEVAEVKAPRKRQKMGIKYSKL